MLEKFETDKRIFHEAYGKMQRTALWNLILDSSYLTKRAFEMVGLTDPHTIAKTAVKVYSILSSELNEYPSERQLLIDNEKGTFDSNEMKFVRGLSSLLNVNVKFRPHDTSRDLSALVNE